MTTTTTTQTVRAETTDNRLPPKLTLSRRSRFASSQGGMRKKPRLGMSTSLLVNR